MKDPIVRDFKFEEGKEYRLEVLDHETYTKHEDIERLCTLTFTGFFDNEDDYYFYFSTVKWNNNDYVSDKIRIGKHTILFIWIPVLKLVEFQT